MLLCNQKKEEEKEEEDATTNLLTQLNNEFEEDDHEDEEFMDKTKNTIIKLANKYGNVVNISFHIDVNDNNNKDCTITYDKRNNEEKNIR